MTDATARFSFPLIAAGQAQKELFHNEALTLIDALIEPAVEAVAVDDPPAAPQPGQGWIVGDAPTGDWAGHARAFAVWTEGGWRFAAPRAGMAVWSLADALPSRFDGSAWRAGGVSASRLVLAGDQVVGERQAPIADPSGGTAADGEARLAIAAILAALRTHGLIGT